MSAAPEVSVVITAYNYGRFIARALESVFAQTYRDIEVIVVDDGSTDDTRECVGAFGSRVAYLYQPNAGMPAAQNTGIAASRGALIAFLDADDVWLPRKLERQLEAMQADPGIGVVYSWWAYVDEAGTPLPQTKQPTARGDVFEELLRGCFVSFSMSLIRRVCFDHVGGLDPSIGRANDWDLWLRIAAAGYTFACVPEILMHNRLHPNHLSGDAGLTLRDSRRALGKALARLSPVARRGALRRMAYRNLYVSSAVQALAQGDVAAADAWFAKGVRLDLAVCGRPAFYAGMAFGLLPPGRQTTTELRTRLDNIVPTLTGMVERSYSTRSRPAKPVTNRRTALSALHVAFAVLYACAGQWTRAVFHLGRSLVLDPWAASGAVSRGVRGHWRAVRAALAI